MRVQSLGLGFLLACLVFVGSFCNADDDQTFEIVGVADCADCQYNSFKPSQAFSGLHVTINCKFKIGEIKRVGDSELDEGGKFKISLPKEVILDGQNLKKCYAQLHNAAAVPCPAHDGLDTTKIVFKSQIDNKITFSPEKAIRFSTALCTSNFLWPLFEYPPLPKTDPWKKTWPKITIPPLKDFGHPWFLPPPYKPKPKPPIYKPLPPPVPIYKPKPKPPVFKPLPPSVPIYKPPTKPFPPPVPIYKPIPKPPAVPIYKPLPPPVPMYKPIPKPSAPFYKPIPKPPVPIYKPPVVKPLPPPVPVYEPPVVTKPLPPPFPLFPLPPLYKKPCPPFTKIPPKFFNHPKFGYVPKLPPFYSNP